MYDIEGLKSFIEPTGEPSPKRPRGRPKGSKNKSPSKAAQKKAEATGLQAKSKVRTSLGESQRSCGETAAEPMMLHWGGWRLHVQRPQAVTIDSTAPTSPYLSPQQAGSQMLQPWERAHSSAVQGPLSPKKHAWLKAALH
ncbi:hypothetical protein LUU34_00946100 [Aix galericulata]|nr:hypothetical protein LUU34_00946100 [Aix galericulata]